MVMAVMKVIFCHLSVEQAEHALPAGTDASHRQDDMIRGVEISKKPSRHDSKE
jgi:hypothetical protein